MSHPYLYFSESISYNGYSVGNSSSEVDGSGLVKKSVKVVQIPPRFNNKNVVEISASSFRETSITSVFIPRTIRYIKIRAFLFCYSLSEVRFESNSQLEKAGKDVFNNCKSLINIDLPPSLKELEYTEYYYLFYAVTSLQCCSYLGTTNFASAKIFEYINSPTIRVSPNYPSTKFGQKSVSYNDGSTCGVSKEPFPEKVYETYDIKRRKVPQLILMIIFFLVS